MNKYQRKEDFLKGFLMCVCIIIIVIIIYWNDFKGSNFSKAIVNTFN